jgi:hypothetical protein
MTSEGSTPDDCRYISNTISKPHPGNNQTQFRRAEKPFVLARSQRQRERAGHPTLMAECRTLVEGHVTINVTKDIRWKERTLA